MAIMTRATTIGRSKTGFLIGRRCSVPIIQRVAVVLLFLSQFAHAKIKGFVPSEDGITCDYPFAEFEIEEISCNYSKSWYSFDGYWNWKTNQEEGVCYWGQHMRLGGTVTVSEGVYRYFDTDVKLCFSDSFCKRFQKTIDLFSYKVEEEEEDAKTYYQYYYDYDGEEEEARQNYNTKFYRMNYQDFLSAGEYEFSIPLTIPELTFVKSSDSYDGLTATITMYSKQAYHYNDAAENGEYTTQTDCIASFELFEEDTNEYRYGYAAAAAIACAGVLGALFAKRRRVICMCAEPVDENADVKEGVSSNFEKM